MFNIYIIIYILYYTKRFYACIALCYVLLDVYIKSEGGVFF